MASYADLFRVPGGRGTLGAALLVVGLCGLILPLPVALIDLLLALNLALALGALVVAARVKKNEDFGVFPSLLLLATLFRLLLNLATTRRILTDAQAGQVVDAFGGFVIRGDLLVGGVMFGIITAVQYLVIARGAERIAEVAARFSLDALPGEQAAIEGARAKKDLPAAAAKTAHEALIRRAHFYGRMDGAVRYVRQDALLGLVITGLNLFGGLAIGLRDGLGISEALAVYGRLTVGDGLVAQLPALMFALAAALLVARTAQGPSLARGLWLESGALHLAALFSLGLGLAPGMPGAPFLAVGAALLSAALIWDRREGRASDAEEGLVLVLPRRHFGDDKASLGEALRRLRKDCSRAVGLPIPAISIREAEPGDELRIMSCERCLALWPAAQYSSARGGFDDFLLALSEVLARNAPSLLSDAEFESWLEQGRRQAGVAGQEALKRGSKLEFRSSLESLVESGLPAPPPGLFLKACATTASGPPELSALRAALASWWLPALLQGVRGPRVRLRTTPDLEQAVLRVLDPDPQDPQPAWWRLATQEAISWREHLARQIDNSGERALLITSPRARRAMTGLVDPGVPVVSTLELSSAGLWSPAGLAKLLSQDVAWVDEPASA